MLLMPLFFCQLFRLLFSPAQNLDSDCPCPLCLIPVPKKIPMCFLSKLANCYLDNYELWQAGQSALINAICVLFLAFRCAREKKFSRNSK